MLFQTSHTISNGREFQMHPILKMIRNAEARRTEYVNRRNATGYVRVYQPKIDQLTRYIATCRRGLNIRKEWAS